MEGEEETNFKPSGAAAALPAPRKADLRRWLVPNSQDYYIDSVSIIERENKKRSI